MLKVKRFELIEPDNKQVLLSEGRITCAIRPIFALSISPSGSHTVCLLVNHPSFSVFIYRLPVLLSILLSFHHSLCSSLHPLSFPLFLYPSVLPCVHLFIRCPTDLLYVHLPIRCPSLYPFVLPLSFSLSFRQLSPSVNSRR